jgi:hypothetical protein
MKLLPNGIKRHKENILNAAEEIYDNFVNSEIVPGLGEVYKQNSRVKLIELAENYKCTGLHTELLLTLQKLLFKRKITETKEMIQESDIIPDSQEIIEGSSEIINDSELLRYSKKIIEDPDVLKRPKDIFKGKI